MKKLLTKTWKTQQELDREILEYRKCASAKWKLQWLQDALDFARQCQKAREKAKKTKHGKAK